MQIRVFKGVNGFKNITQYAIKELIGSLFL